jgi:hypothetical protein
MSGAWQQVLPLSDGWSQTRFETALVEFIKELVLGSGLTWAAVTSNLLTARYEPLYGRPEAGAASDLLSGIATAEDPHVQVHLGEQTQIDESVFVPNVQPHQFCASVPLALQPAELTELRRAGADIGSAFFSSVPEAIRLTYLTDFIEDLAGLTFGQRFTHQFFTACFGPVPSECSS